MVGHIFNVKGHGGGFLGIFLVFVFLFVGVVEIVSICIRPVALMFRLYGNVFAGENILETVMHMGGLVLRMAPGIALPAKSCWSVPFRHWSSHCSRPFLQH